MKRQECIERACRDLREGKAFYLMVVGPRGEVDVGFWHPDDVALEDLMAIAAKGCKHVLEIAQRETPKPRIIIPDLRVISN